MGKRTSVFLADDHPLIRAALTEAIKSRPDLEFLGAAESGRVTLERVRLQSPDVLILDMRLGDLDGLQVLNAMVRDAIPTRVLFLSTFTDSSTVYDALAAGASGYLDKSSTPAAICDAVRAVARGETALSDGVEAGVIVEVRARGREQQSGLSPRELEVLRLIAAGLTAPQIGERIYIARSTVKSHMQSIYRKLGVGDRASAVAEAMRQGLVE